MESRSDGTPANHKNNLNPEQSERVVASHGVGRKPGDRRRMQHIEAKPSAAHSYRRGSVIFCLLAGAAPAARAYPCLLSNVPGGTPNSARLRLANCRFIKQNYCILMMQTHHFCALLCRSASKSETGPNKTAPPGFPDDAGSYLILT